jgi:hypothetical protein
MGMKFWPEYVKERDHVGDWKIKLKWIPKK